MHARTQYAPLTLEEKRFAEDNHQVVIWYLRERGLNYDEWYDVVIFRYLLAVKKWFAQPELHRWKFSTIAKQAMRSAIGNEQRKRKNQIRTISLDSIVPGTEDLTFMDIITEDNLNFVIYVEEDMNISYDVIVPERKHVGGVGHKSDEVIALESFLATKKMKNMRIEYDTTDEAKKKLPSLQAYKRKNKLQNQIEIFRVETNIYIVRIMGEKK